jgi:hypothetical protein
MTGAAIRSRCSVGIRCDWIAVGMTADTGKTSGVTGSSGIVRHGMAASPLETSIMEMATDAITIVRIHVVLVASSDLGRAVLVILCPVMTDFADVPGGS